MVLQSARFVMALMLVLMSTMLFAPIATSSAHATASPATVSEPDTHGHVESTDWHDQIEHVHDVPYMQQPESFNSVRPLRSWQALAQWVPAEVSKAAMDRPPRP